MRRTKSLRLRAQLIPKLALTLAFTGAAAFLLSQTAPPTQEATASSFEGTKLVLVRYKNADFVDSTASQSEINATQNAIENSSAALEESLADESGHIQQMYTYTNFPLALYAVDSAGEAALKNDPNVQSVMDDIMLEKSAVLPSPIEAIGGSVTQGFTDGSSYFNGNGYAVAILDDGVDKNHPALQGRVIQEICIGFNGSIPMGNEIISSPCPEKPGAEVGLITAQAGAGVASNCTELAEVDGCSHGTAVAGAAAMAPVGLTLGSDTINTSGSATGAKIIAIQTNIIREGASGVTMSPNLSLSLIAFDVLSTPSNNFGLPVASANLSAGGGAFASDYASCRSGNGAATYDDFQTIFGLLRAAGIAPVIANGNNGDEPLLYNKVAFPACVEGAIAVGATDVTGSTVSYYSNNAPITTFFAPGGNAPSSLLYLPTVNTNTYEGVQGTSFSAPIVAGAFAVLRQKYPTDSIDQLQTRLQTTSRAITDTRTGHNNLVKPFIQVDEALALQDTPVATPVVISDTSYPDTPLEYGEEFTFEADITGADTCHINHGIGSINIPSDPYHLTATLTARSGYNVYCTNFTGGSFSYNLDLDVIGEPAADPVSPSLDVPSTGSLSTKTQQDAASTINPLTILAAAVLVLCPAIVIVKRALKNKIRL